MPKVAPPNSMREDTGFKSLPKAGPNMLRVRGWAYTGLFFLFWTDVFVELLNNLFNKTTDLKKSIP